jgi:hypothetical protein
MRIFEVDILACVETWLEMSYRVLWFLWAYRRLLASFWPSLFVFCVMVLAIDFYWIF